MIHIFNLIQVIDNMLYLFMLLLLCRFQVRYIDGDEEILNMRKEKWYFLNESKSSKVGNYISHLWFFVLFHPPDFVSCFHIFC